MKVTTGSVNKVSRLCLVAGMQDLFQQIRDNTIVDIIFMILNCSEACVRCNVHAGISWGTDARCWPLTTSAYAIPDSNRFFFFFFFNADRQVCSLRRIVIE